MINKDKVMKSIECCLRPDNTNLCGECSYKDVAYDCKHALIKDVHELLKEQEAIPVDTKVIGTFNGDMEVYCCRDCRTILDPAFHYCPNCGKAVEWNDS